MTRMGKRSHHLTVKIHVRAGLHRQRQHTNETSVEGRSDLEMMHFCPLQKGPFLRCLPPCSSFPNVRAQSQGGLSVAVRCAAAVIQPRLHRQQPIS